MNISFYHYASLDDAQKLALLQRTEGDLGPFLEKVIRERV